MLSCHVGVARLCKLSEPMWKVGMKKMHAINIVCVLNVLVLTRDKDNLRKEGLGLFGLQF